MPFREKGITAVVQIQNYKKSGKDRNPYYHTDLDSFAYINPDYFLNQIKATTAIAAHLAVPLVIQH